MRHILVPALFVLGAGAALLPASAEAAGCLSGAAVGGVAGHVAGGHGALGAAAGCAVGHHENAVNKRNAAAQNPNGGTGPSTKN